MGKVIAVCGELASACDFSRANVAKFATSKASYRSILPVERYGTECWRIRLQRLDVVGHRQRETRQIVETS